MSEQEIHDACEKLGVGEYTLNGRKYSGFKPVVGEGEEGHLKDPTHEQKEVDLTGLRSKGRPTELRQPPIPDWSPAGEEFAQRVMDVKDEPPSFILALQRDVDLAIVVLQEKMNDKIGALRGRLIDGFDWLHITLTEFLKP